MRWGTTTCPSPLPTWLPHPAAACCWCQATMGGWWCTKPGVRRMEGAGNNPAGHSPATGWTQVQPIIGLPVEQPLSVPNKLSLPPSPIGQCCFAAGWAQVRSIIGLPVEQFHHFCAAWHRSGHCVFAGGSGCLPMFDAAVCSASCGGDCTQVLPSVQSFLSYGAAAALGGGCLFHPDSARMLPPMPTCLSQRPWPCTLQPRRTAPCASFTSAAARRWPPWPLTPRMCGRWPTMQPTTCC